MKHTGNASDFFELYAESDDGNAGENEMLSQAKQDSKMIHTDLVSESYVNMDSRSSYESSSKRVEDYVELSRRTPTSFYEIGAVDDETDAKDYVASHGRLTNVDKDTLLKVCF